MRRAWGYGRFSDEDATDMTTSLETQEIAAIANSEVRLVLAHTKTEEAKT